MEGVPLAHASAHAAELEAPMPAATTAVRNARASAGTVLAPPPAAIALARDDDKNMAAAGDGSEQDKRRSGAN